MKDFNITIHCTNPTFSKYRRMVVFLTLFLFFFVNSVQAKPLNCSDIVFSLQVVNNGSGCCYRLLAEHPNDDTCFMNVQLILSAGEFSNFTPLPGWQYNGGGSEYTVRPSVGFIPPGASIMIAEFCVEGDPSPTLTLLWNDLCVLEGCATEFLVNGCFDPLDASIIGVKYKECGGLPYINQTPLSGWTIQLLDADGNMLGEEVTGVDGTYGFYDLPAGTYVVREVQQPGWTANVPASGQTTVDLLPSQQRYVNYGNCPPPPPPSCDCPSGTQASLVNLVQNGDFSSGGGFSTSYALNNNNPPLQPGQYWIGSNPSTINAGFAACGDHTSGSGDMMVVNGGPGQNNTIWSQTFTVAPNTTYKFEAWVTSLSSTSPANVGAIFMIGNNLFGGVGVFAPVTTCSWERLCYEWPNNFNATTVTFLLINQNVAGTGNDFAIDDISFRRCVNPIGHLSGVVYRECEAKPYTNQPGLSGMTVQLQDTSGNLIAETVTDSSGGYAFFDLPPGLYYARVIGQADDTPLVPEGGGALIDLEGGGVAQQHFGVCRLPVIFCTCPVPNSPGTNLVFNHDFSAGPVGFGSAYSQNTNVPPLLLDQYWVGSVPSFIDGDFPPAPCSDHTPGAGNMLIAKGNPGGVISPIYWEQWPITVTPNTNYIFSAWVMPLHGAYPDFIVLEVGNTLVAVKAPGSTPCSWKRICGIWNSGPNPLPQLIKVRGLIVGSGDAIAIDDISFRPCGPYFPPPLSGVIHRSCDGLPYTDQPVLSGWTVQVQDTMGNLIDEQVTDSSGTYAFYDLPDGVYNCSVVVQPGWTANVPPTGQTTVQLESGMSVVANFGVCQLPALLCNCPVNESPGTNLVTNPNFNVSGGFNSDYMLANAPLPTNGEYAILGTCHTCPKTCGDHTTGVGSALVAVGNPGGVASPSYWSQQVSVTPGKKYVFSAWVSSEGSIYSGNVSIQVDGAVVGQSLALGYTNCAWKKICGVWNNLNKTSVTISVVGSSVSSSDKLGLDDISFRECSSSIIGPITGIIHRTCNMEPYTDQPVLSDWTVQLLDTMGNLLSEQLTDAEGAYAFYDWPPAPYWVKVVVQPGWEPNFPASGQVLLDLTTPGQSAVQNFGVCNVNCQCNTIQTTVLPTSSGPNACCYSLSIMSANQCYTYINIQVDAGTSILPSFVQTGWMATQINQQWIQLTLSNGGLVPIGPSSPLTFCVSGNSVHSILVTHGFTDSGGTYECDNNYTFSCSDCGGGCPPPTELAVSDIDITSASISWIPSVCAESTWLYLIDEQDSSDHISRPVPVSSLLLEDLIPGALYRVVAFSMCGTEMSGPSDTMLFSTPCTDCPGNLLKNGGFEIPRLPYWPFSHNTPSAPGEIGYSAGWQSTNANSEGDWFSWGYPIFSGNNFPGNYYNTSTQLYTILPANCGKKYAGIDLSSCEGLAAQLSSPIAYRDGFEIGFWWTIQEPIPTPQGFIFWVGLRDEPCDLSSSGTWCTWCPGRGLAIEVNSSHIPGTWYYSSFQGTYNHAGQDLTTLVISPPAFNPINNYVYIDEVCVRKRQFSCNVGSPRITHSPDQPHAFYGEADLGAGSTLVSAVWDFGDGTQDSSCCLGSVIHDFAPGTYEVCLTVMAMDTSGMTCSNSTCITVDITAQSTKCDNVAAFIYPAFGEDCCYTVNINNVEPNCFTQIDLTLSSGTFVNSQFFGNYNIVNNGNMVSLTPIPGPFLPVGQDIPVMICDPGGTDPYTVDIDFVYAGDVCHRSISYSCVDNCACLGFTNLQFTTLTTPPLPPVPVDCENTTPVELPCIANDAFYNFEGNFGCTNECVSSVHYQFFDQNSNQIQYGQANYDSGLDYFNLNPGFKFQPGTYDLLLTGLCGTGDTCYCNVTFTVPECPCCSEDINEFNQTIANEISISQDPANCKATLNIGTLPCQRVEWVNWGDFTVDQGPFLSGAMPMHSYAQSGTYTISYKVTEFSSVTGLICFQTTISETIQIDCNCHCGIFDMEIRLGGALNQPLVCGQAVDLGFNQGFAVYPKFQCQGNFCPPTALVDWMLTGPNTNLSGTETATPGVIFTILPLNPGQFTTPGQYTLTLTGHCDQNLCPCVITFDVQDPCCSDQAAFLAAAAAVQTFGTLGTCTLSFQAVGLNDCMRITYDWGDNTSSGPFGDNVPITHTYAQAGTYNVCYTIEEIDFFGNVCWTYQSCEQVDVICSDCGCGTLTDLYIKPGGVSTQVFCGGAPINLGCPANGNYLAYIFTGKHSCVGVDCPLQQFINYTLSGPGGTFSEQTWHSGTPYFSVGLLPSWFTENGLYTLTVVPSCGGVDCPPCVIKFNVNCPSLCPCDTDDFNADLIQGYSTIVANNSCKACFTPNALTDCDMVEWFVGGTSMGMLSGTKTFCHTFPGSGTYNVMMSVTRKNSTGGICASNTFSTNVTVSCGIIAHCDNSLYPNPRFSEGAIAGGLNSGGSTNGWFSPWGEAKVVEGYAGSTDGWTIELSGNYDTSDVVSTIQPICLEKNTGTFTLRFAIEEKGSGDELALRLYRGTGFGLDSPAYWNPIRCLALATLDIQPLEEGWYEAQIPFDISDWMAVDSCGDFDSSGVLVRPALFVRNVLNSNQGGSETFTVIHLDNVCLDGTLVSVNDPRAKRSIRIFPNPNPGTFSVELPEAATSGMAFRVVGLTGQGLKEQSAQAGSSIQTVEAGDLPAGLYFLQVLSEGQVLAVEKFVKQ